MESDVRAEPRVFTGVRLVVEVLCGLFLVAIMLYTVGNVISRVLTGSPLPAVIELITRWWMVPLVFGGWLLAHLADEHIRVDFIVERTTGFFAPLYRVLNKALLVVFLAIITYGGWAGASENRLRGEHGIDTHAPVWITRYAVPIMAALFCVFVVYEIVKTLAASRPAAQRSHTDPSGEGPPRSDGSADPSTDTRTAADHDDT